MRDVIAPFRAGLVLRIEGRDEEEERQGVRSARRKEEVSNLYARIQGERGGVTRCGHHYMTADIDGWNVGIAVRASFENGKASFDVYETGGSHGRTDRVLLARVREGQETEMV